MKQATFDAGRVGALSDGVFAIAMTLLVLELKLPELGSGLGRDAFVAALREQSPRFLSWLCRLDLSSARGGLLYPVLDLAPQRAPRSGTLGGHLLGQPRGSRDRALRDVARRDAAPRCWRET